MSFCYLHLAIQGVAKPVSSEGVGYFGSWAAIKPFSWKWIATFSVQLV
jgi:hypothetical protein